MYAYDRVLIMCVQMVLGLGLSYLIQVFGPRLEKMCIVAYL